MNRHNLGHPNATGITSSYSTNGEHRREINQTAFWDEKGRLFWSLFDFFYETMSGYLEPWGQGVNIQTSSRNIAHQMTDLLLRFPPPDFQIFRHPWILIKFCNEYSLYGNIGSRVSNIQQLDKFCTKQKCDVSWNEIKMFKRVVSMYIQGKPLGIDRK